MDKKKLMQVASGKVKAQLVLKNGNVFAGFTGKFLTTDIAIQDGYIAGLGNYQGEEEIDLQGQYITPGFIDSHVHIESSMLIPFGFAQAVVPKGTTTVVADPHEIANVGGEAGIQYMLDASENLPLQIKFMLPSCVPATPLEDAGAVLGAKELKPFLEDSRVLGLGELMDVPGVLNESDTVWEKLNIIDPHHFVDGHAPMLTGKELMGYAAAGVDSDHECVTVQEAEDRLAAGMYLMIREGSAAHNLEALLPVITAANSRFCCFCADDRHPGDLMAEGGINAMVREATKLGLPVEQALQMATVNPATYFGIRDTGVIAPGRRADLLVFSNLKGWEPKLVFTNGTLVAKEGQCLEQIWKQLPTPPVPERLSKSMNLPELTMDQLALPIRGDKANVIGLIPHQLLTRHLWQAVPVKEGQAVADPQQDILKLAVFERHHNTGKRGLGLVKGFGLKQGAIAQTIGHDSHNLIVIGTNDEDMLMAAQSLQACGGGIAIAVQGEVKEILPLPVGGLMTDKSATETAKQTAKMEQLAYQLGVDPQYDPFLTLAFLSLPVIPELKLSDRGLVKVLEGRIIGLEEET
ncbi:Adenine deaminase [Anaerovibrio sp. JC8]|uniref:adenine deaminase n=1 Tax=Anaerovibrio sp. JC8 TaxID=1240085 RepID=UPI000A0C8423|nr:adenine deaminase [Anaerovibrio sp. JC8]ORU00803.1 Adenine deaminase [Anaerovibrio sp. JC8]